MPVIAEEEVAAGRIPAHDDMYFLVDPLDGTREFIRGGDDYTVNIHSRSFEFCTQLAAGFVVAHY